MTDPAFSPAQIEQIVISVRLYLYNRGRPCGAWPVRQLLDEYGVRPLLSLSSIKRILSQNHLTHSRTGLYP